MRRFLYFFVTLALLASLAGCGTAKPGTTAEPAADAQETSKVADASQMTAVEDVVTDGMEPVYAASIRDGVYEVKVDSSSSMFKIEGCELTVADGVMTALLTMSGSSYGYVYPGTAEEAAAADASAYIAAGENAEGKNTFALPVEALDAGVQCAAWSKNKELWYDRTLVFRTDSLPLDAFADGYFTTAESLSLADGIYSVAVTLTGGSGKASVQSPAKLLVDNGAASAQIVWSSANYDYMKVNGEKIVTEIVDGHSTCVIPVAAFDRPLAVIADTTAMSQAHEIEYTLRFDSASLEPAQP